jgi:transposase
VFTERVDGVARPHGRRTDRADESLTKLAWAMSCEAGSHVADHFGIPVSAPTLRRLLRRKTPSLPLGQPAPRVVGVDDWAMRKGRTYGTIIVDLERHRVLELLPDRSAESVAAWFRERPSIEIVSRDRASCYADGVTAGAPQAVQVADRWHLLHNLGDAVRRFFERHPATLRLVAAELAVQRAGADQPATTAAEDPNTAAAPVLSPRQAERRRQFEAAKALHASGQTLVSIGRQLHLSRQTVARYVVATELPRRGGTSVPSSVTPFLPVLRQRWADGCQNGQLLWDELREVGYGGSYSSVCRALKHFRRGDGRRLRHQRQAPPPVAPLTPRKATWLFVARADDLTDLQRDQRDAICRACPEAERMRLLVEQFTAIVRERCPELLDPWLEAADESNVLELKRFASGLKQDYAAVRAGIELPWSNGQLEGQVNRLKLIKRVMYGRAGFDLLRLRVLAAA